MPVERKLSASILRMAKKMPVITLTGPRQSGKTTLAKSLFKGYQYVSLENPDTREYAESDPRGFLSFEGRGMIIDEAQNVPSLFSYIQSIVDEQKKMGMFVLTGSQNFLLLEKISQTLAGRTAVFNLLPFSLEEIADTRLKRKSSLEYMLNGFYPPLFDRRLKPGEWYPSYVQTYLERDVRKISQITDLRTFQLFLRLCAARIGQMINFTELGMQVGVSYQTVKHWISVLETSFTFFSLPPYFNNFGKRLTKSPKLYFYDTGLACHLLGVRNEKELALHYMKGALYENFIISEIMKNCFNRGQQPRMFFWNDNHGNEVDCIVEGARYTRAIEIKSGQTVKPEFFRGLEFWQKTSGARPAECLLMYDGKEKQKRMGGMAMPWTEVASIF